MKTEVHCISDILQLFILMSFPENEKTSMLYYLRMGR